ncbi:MAG: hypothetical protein R2991_10635 [Thermoanaerobaculia bacterium]
MNVTQALGLSVLLAGAVACQGATGTDQAEVRASGAAEAMPAGGDVLKPIDCSPGSIELAIEVYEDLSNQTYHARLSNKFGSLCVSGNLKEVVWRAQSALGPGREVVLSDIAWQSGSCEQAARGNRSETLEVAADPADPLVWRGTRSSSHQPVAGDCWRYGAEVTVTDPDGTHTVLVDPEIIWKR